MVETVGRGRRPIHFVKNRDSSKITLHFLSTVRNILSHHCVYQF